MSLDTSLADPISNLSPWQQMKARLFAEREITNDALRRGLSAQPVEPRTAMDALKDVQRYERWLTVPAVIASKAWTEDVTAKLKAAKAELTAARADAVRLTAGAR